MVKDLGEERYIQQLYDFLQGKCHPDNIQVKDAPTFSAEQAWHVIYCMQEYFGLLDDNFERCKDCGCIYDSQKEGMVISEETEPATRRNMLGEIYTHTFKEEYGTYCGECRPD